MALAGILLGFGAVVDPPSKHVIEARGGAEKASPETDEAKYRETRSGIGKAALSSPRALRRPLP